MNKHNVISIDLAKNVFQVCLMNHHHAPADTPFDQRALPSTSVNQPYSQYEIVIPLPTQSGPAAPWFDQPGGGTQYKTTQNVDWLIRNGYITPVQ